MALYNKKIKSLLLNNSYGEKLIMKVLCFGSLNIDYVYSVPHFISGGETLAARSLKVFSGGKGLNQSVALAKAGLNVFHAGAVGDEGMFLVRELEAVKVDTSFIKCLKDVLTGHAIIQNNDNGDNCIILFGGANRKITITQIEETLSNFSEGDALILQNEINDIEYIAEHAKKHGMIVALNPSPMEENIIPVFRYADYILLNEVEAGQFLNRNISNETPEKISAMLREKLSDKKIILTLGTQGAVYSDEKISFHQPAVKVKAVDTTAAGDTFTGFFLAGIFEGQTPQWAMNFAANASAIAVTKHGAAPSIPTREEVLAKI